MMAILYTALTLIGAVAAIVACYIGLRDYWDKKTKITGYIEVEETPTDFNIYVKLFNNGQLALSSFELIEEDSKDYPFNIKIEQIKKYNKLLKIIGDDLNVKNLDTVNFEKIYQDLLEIDRSHVEINTRFKYSKEANILEMKKSLIDRLLFIKEYKKKENLNKFYRSSKIDVFKPSDECKLLLYKINKTQNFYRDMEIKDFYLTAEYYHVYHLNFISFNLFKLIRRFVEKFEKIMNNEVYFSLGPREKPKTFVFDESEKSIQYNKSQCMKIKIDKLLKIRDKSRFDDYNSLNILFNSKSYLTWFDKLSNNNKTLVNSINIDENEDILYFFKELKNIKQKSFQTSYLNLINKVIDDKDINFNIKVTLYKENNYEVST